MQIKTISTAQSGPVCPRRTAGREVHLPPGVEWLASKRQSPVVASRRPSHHPSRQNSSTLQRRLHICSEMMEPSKVSEDTPHACEHVPQSIAVIIPRNILVLPMVRCQSHWFCVMLGRLHQEWGLGRHSVQQGGARDAIFVINSYDFVRFPVIFDA